MNKHAADRVLKEYNLAGYPTVFFDGGYRVVVGGGWGVEAAYIAAIDACGLRPVPDIDVSLSFTWLGDATMDIRVSVQNNDTSEYSGTIRVYVTEIVSTMGWNDDWGRPFTFAFLDYAFNQNISINPGDTWPDSIIWNGNEHNDGYGHDFGDITLGNVMVIAAVFNGEWHQGYADPPDQNPFYAYYLDDVTGLWVNVPPYTPGDPTPEDESMGVKVNVDLSWTGGDVNIFDPPTYDVYFGTSTPPPLVSSDQSDTTYDPGIMEFHTTYYWQIVAEDNYDSSATGPIWSFTTMLRGDCNADGEVNVSDVAYMINFVFKSGSPPNPMQAGDVNCDVIVNVSDVVYLISYLFKSGPAPC